MVALRVEIALHDILFVVPIVCACPAAWGVGNLHQTAAVEEEPCPSAVGSMSPGAVDLVEEKAFDRFRRLVSVEAAVFDSELLCHRVGQFFMLILTLWADKDLFIFPGIGSVFFKMRILTLWTSHVTLSDPCSANKLDDPVALPANFSHRKGPSASDCAIENQAGAASASDCFDEAFNLGCTVL